MSTSFRCPGPTSAGIARPHSNRTPTSRCSPRTLRRTAPPRPRHFCRWGGLSHRPTRHSSTGTAAVLIQRVAQHHPTRRPLRIAGHARPRPRAVGMEGSSLGNHPSGTTRSVRGERPLPLAAALHPARLPHCHGGRSSDIPAFRSSRPPTGSSSRPPLRGWPPASGAAPPSSGYPPQWAAHWRSAGPLPGASSPRRSRGAAPAPRWRLPSPRDSRTMRRNARWQGPGPVIVNQFLSGPGHDGDPRATARLS